MKNSIYLKINNTLTRSIEKFCSITPNQVKLYVCGITPYDYAHIGHGRCYVTFDFLYRILTFLDYKVIYCRNFTDIDDKIIKRAQERFNNTSKYYLISDEFITKFQEDMISLNCLPPTFQPRVTKNIPEIIKFIENLISSGHAYQVNSNVYYSVKSFPDYGKLSKRNLEDLKSGARININQEKHNPLDFALWKSAPADQPGWDTPWGYGRPGWHIECSAFVCKYLGEHIDIHGGGMDLIFPHHENEIAQTEAIFGSPMACYWMHNAFVNINQEKMSKSLGNYIILKNLFKQYDPMIVRYYFLLHNYTNPLEFSDQDVDSASKSYKKLCTFFQPYSINNSNISTKIFSITDLENQKLLENKLIYSLIQALCDNLNGAQFFGLIFENLNYLRSNPEIATIIKSLIIQLTGLTLEEIKQPEQILTPEIQDLIEQREQARLEKNWALADSLRDKLKSLGYIVQDKKIKQN